MMRLNRIKEVLEEKGISQKWLAKELNKSFSTMNAYACNRHQPSLEILYQISRILHVKISELLVDNDHK
jgi:putative transcriptional regulator